MNHRYAVVGDPVAHSLSPRIHALFAEQTGEALTYEAQRGDPEGFEGQVREWLSAGLSGLNVTVPFKERACALADQVSERARLAGAANTLWTERDDQDEIRIHADNTDGAGLIRDLRDRHGVTLRDARILILGAGGATRGIVCPLLAQGPRSVRIANRSPEKALALADLFSRHTAATNAPIPIDGCALADLQVGAPTPFDLIIQATSAGLDGSALTLDPRVAHEGSFAYDLAYGPAAEPFLEWAGDVGIRRSSDGLGMLVEQAAESFLIWRGQRPATDAAFATLRAELSLATEAG